ncbi:hypothetical protein [Nocardia sp. NPDC051981]|uniref:hypothetical protein n=1 Tax=Nocardia sp. NPDC051981 TaxID=3155417 RepID=UPI00343E89BD
MQNRPRLAETIGRGLVGGASLAAAASVGDRPPTRAVGTGCSPPPRWRRRL